MHAEVLFVAGYALTLVALSAGLHRLGSLGSSPWRSPVLAGHRRAASEPPPPEDPGWTHAESSRLYDVIAAVAGVAAATITSGEAVRHHAWPELLLLVVVAGVGLGSSRRLLRTVHA